MKILTIIYDGARLDLRTVISQLRILGATTMLGTTPILHHLHSMLVPRTINITKRYTFWDPMRQRKERGGWSCGPRPKPGNGELLETSTSGGWRGAAG